MAVAVSARILQSLLSVSVQVAFTGGSLQVAGAESIMWQCIGGTLQVALYKWRCAGGTST